MQANGLTHGGVLKNNVFIYPKDIPINADDLTAFINQNEQYSEAYQKLYNYYIGNHEILSGQRALKRPDNRLVVNMASEIVNMFSGYFMGKPPKISLSDNAQNDKLQNWFNANSFIDKLAEVSKQADIYGRSYMFMYQNEQSETAVSVIDPTSAFMIYDDTIEQKPLYFIRYAYDNNGNLYGTKYSCNAIEDFNAQGQIINSDINILKAVPAFEFFDNEERISLIGRVSTLIDAYDKAISQKANQVQYFDNAYLKIIGLQLERDKDGNPILDLDGNQIIYSPDDANGACVDFLSKPDGDVMQENLLNRLVDSIYQISMVTNLRDEAFSGNSSGVAIQYKLLPMQNMAALKERKFTQELRQLLDTVFEAGTVINNNIDNLYTDLTFKFTRNMPNDDMQAAQTAQILTGIVSKETQLSVLPFVDDPKSEIQRMEEESKDSVLNAINNQASAIDLLKEHDSNEADTTE